MYVGKLLSGIRLTCSLVALWELGFVDSGGRTLGKAWLIRNVKTINHLKHGYSHLPVRRFSSNLQIHVLVLVHSIKNDILLNAISLYFVRKPAATLRLCQERKGAVAMMSK